MFGPRKLQPDQHLTDDLLSAYIDGQVTAGERAQVDAHLADCPACAGELRALQATVGLLREMPPVTLPRAFTISADVTTRRAWGVSLWDTLTRGWGYRALQGATALAVVLLMTLCSGDLLLQTLPAMGPMAMAPAAPTQALDQEWLAAQPSPTEARAAREAVEGTATSPAFLAPTQPPVPTSPPVPDTPVGKATHGSETPAVAAGASPETPTAAPPAPLAETPRPAAPSAVTGVPPTAAPGEGARAQAVTTPTEEATTDAGATPNPAPTAVALAPQPSPALPLEPAPVAGPQLDLVRLAVCGAEGVLLAVVVGLAIITGLAWLVRRQSEGKQGTR